MEERIRLENTNSKILIFFPEEMDLTSLDGKVNFYRPSNKVLDFSIDFSEITSNEFIVSTEKLVPGRWNINITWQRQDEEFLFKKEINY